MLKTKYNFGLLFLCLLFSFNTVAQKKNSIDGLSDKQIEEYYKSAQARGLSEQQLETMALANGYTEEDITKLRERYNRIKTGINKPVTETKVNSSSREQLGDLSRRAEPEINEVAESKKEKPETVRSAELFGTYLFKNNDLRFEPNLRLATPPNYILGPDDELNVDVSGYAYQHYSLKVSPEGTVKIENIPPVYVSGMTIQNATGKITEKLKSIFAGLKNGSLVIDVTLGSVRTIKVTLAGEVNHPGTYSVSSLATIFNALYLSGGPGANGSFRNIQLLRGNKVIQKLDLYTFLMNGSMTGNQTLQDQDVIFIPVAERKIEVKGEVVRNMKFELKPGETVGDAIRFAGGFTDNAYVTGLNVVRKTGKEKKLISVAESQFSHFGLQNGDAVDVGEILDRFENKVEILGAVFRPGIFALSEDLTMLSHLIKKAEGLREDAFLNRAILKRERENMDPEFLGVNIEKLLKGEIEDIKLKREDVLVIKSITEIRELRKVSIQGAVIEAGEYDYVDNMTVYDLIILAGGFKEGATQKRIEVARRVYNDESNDKTIEVVNLEVSKDFLDVKTSIILMPFDQVFIRELPNYQSQKHVKIEGEVNYPGQYAISNRNEKIYDLIARAGGLRPESYLAGAKYYRDGKIVAVDLKEVVGDPESINNLSLEQGDLLFIPKKDETVKISGEVLNPTSVAYQTNFSFKDYIDQAGGFSDSAFVKKTYVRYANGLTDRTGSFFGIKQYPKVERGMEIIVPVKRREKMSKAEIISMSTGFVSLSAVLLTLFNLLR